MGKEQGHSKGVLDAMRIDIGESEGKNKCGEVKGRLKQVGPCRDCIVATGAVMRWWCDGEGGGGKRYRVWGVVKEG